MIDKLTVVTLHRKDLEKQGFKEITDREMKAIAKGMAEHLKLITPVSLQVAAENILKRK